MRRVIIVDTTVWVDYFSNTKTAETRWLEGNIGHESIALTDLILSEILQGIDGDRLFSEIRMQMLEFEVFENGGLDVAVASAENYRKLRAKGYFVRKTIDCWIASFCMLGGYELLHRDRDFEPFERELGLKVVKA